jgi:phage terminase large subunit-like protein
MLQRELKKRITEGQLGRRMFAFYPETGPLRRELYPKHMAFFAAGSEHNERAFIGGNRTGKSTCVGYEATCHLIGWYPEWWVGRRFYRPIQAWLCGEDTKALRESLQVGLLGRIGEIGTGMIPKENLLNLTPRSGVAEAYDTVTIRHSSGGISRAVLKTYDQGRESYQGAKVEVIMLDEEPPLPIYTESLMRTMATVPGEENGIVMAAFTPLKGLSDVVQTFLPALEVAMQSDV